MNGLTKLVRFQFVWQAHIFSGILEEEGITAFIQEVPGLDAALGYTIFVDNENLEKAKTLLSEFDANQQVSSDGE